MLHYITAQTLLAEGNFSDTLEWCAAFGGGKKECVWGYPRPLGSSAEGFKNSTSQSRLVCIMPKEGTLHRE